MSSFYDQFILLICISLSASSVRFDEDADGLKLSLLARNHRPQSVIIDALTRCIYVAEVADQRVI